MKEWREEVVGMFPCKWFCSDEGQILLLFFSYERVCTSIGLGCDKQEIEDVEEELEEL